MVQPLYGVFKMSKFLKIFYWKKSFLILCCLLGISVGVFPALEAGNQHTQGNWVDFVLVEETDSLVTMNENSLLPQANPFYPPPKTKKIGVVITAYSSTPWETDDNPYITASGSWVREGVIANNLLPFGTKVKIPELYGNKTFVVEDRMHWSKGYYHVDIWFPSYEEALYFGSKRTYIEILEN
jgi:3D (Asp-Asp-Asp) domain-containing protein